MIGFVSYGHGCAEAKPLSCIIIDDEPIARRGLALMASHHPLLKLMGVFPGPLEALEWMKSNSVDLVFLDIEMPDMRGIDFAGHLPSQTLVVFTTAYSEYAACSYDLDAVDYLLKPIKAARFDRAVQKALLRSADRTVPGPAEGTVMLTLRVDRRFMNIAPESIVYIEGVKDYVKIHTDTERLISRVTIKALLELLPPERFLRIHKSYVVNTQRVKAYDSTSVTLCYSGSETGHGVDLPVGASFRGELHKLRLMQN